MCVEGRLYTSFCSDFAQELLTILADGTTTANPAWDISVANTTLLYQSHFTPVKFTSTCKHLFHMSSDVLTS